MAKHADLFSEPCGFCLCLSFLPSHLKRLLDSEEGL